MGVNDLPLSMILSWYEQKAVAILLTLLHLGIKDIRLGPTLPAFVTPDVLDVLVEELRHQADHDAGSGPEGNPGITREKRFTICLSPVRDPFPHKGRGSRNKADNENWITRKRLRKNPDQWPEEIASEISLSFDGRGSG